MSGSHLNIFGTSLQASRLGLGTHSLHRLMSATSRQRLLALADELGVTYFDTAPSYGAGIAEHELGRFLQGKRSRIVLTTKFGISSSRMGVRIPGWNYAAMAGRLAKRALSPSKAASAPKRAFTAQQARVSLEGSLRALKTDYVDILYLHEPSIAEVSDGDALAAALEDLKASGKFRHIGLSGQSADCAQITARYPRLAEVLQLQVNAGSDGLPGKVSPEPQAGVRFWECPSGLPAQLPVVVERLVSASPESVTLLSTNSANCLREAVAVLDEPVRQNPRSATSYLP